MYLGNTDGRVYSFGARNGALAWATATGAYVYASASVADPKGLGPTVYVGSYDGNLYAFNAQSGAVRWKHPVGGRISGSSTVIGNVVYFSSLGSKSTIGLNVVSGSQVFSFPDGAFTPIIADYHALYLDGYAQDLPAAARPGAQAEATRQEEAQAAPHHACSGQAPQGRAGQAPQGRAGPASQGGAGQACAGTEGRVEEELSRARDHATPRGLHRPAHGLHRPQTSRPAARQLPAAVTRRSA